jgi:hypothetical protein
MPSSLLGHISVTELLHRLFDMLIGLAIHTEQKRVVFPIADSMAKVS